MRLPPPWIGVGEERCGGLTGVFGIVEQFGFRDVRREKTSRVHVSAFCERTAAASESGV